MRQLVSIGVTLAAAAALFAVGWLSGDRSARAAQADAAALIREAADAVEARTAERIAQIRVVNQTITGQVREVIRESPIYRDCVVPDAMQRLLEAARQGRAEPGADGGSVPAAGTGPP